MPEAPQHALDLSDPSDQPPRAGPAHDRAGQTRAVAVAVTFNRATAERMVASTRACWRPDVADQLQAALAEIDRLRAETKIMRAVRTMTLKTINISLDELNLLSRVVARDRDRCLSIDGHMRLLTEEDEQRVPLHQSILNKLEKACAS